MVDIFLLISSAIIFTVLSISSIYILAIYCHPEDTGIGKNTNRKSLFLKM